MRAINQTADFLTGPEEPGSDPYRDALEKGTDAATQGSFYNSTTASIAQFATGMLGAGKLAGLTKLPEAAEAAGGIAEEGYQAAKAASVAAVAFDPHQDMLSGLVSSVPVLGPTIAGFLASSPDTPAFEGRLKNALESIGMDAAMAGVFMAAGKVYRALQSGDHVALPDATAQLQEAQAKAPQQGTGGEPGSVEATAATEAPPEGTAAPTEPTAAPVAANANVAADHEGVAGETISEPNAGGASQGGLTITAEAKFKPSAIISPEDAESLVASTRSDLDATDAAGSVQGAIEEGHVFGQGEGVPWNKLNLPGEVDDFVARVTDTIQGDIDTLKGGAVLTDASLARRVNGVASYFNADPATIAGAIQQAGANSSKMVAQAEAAYLIASRMFQDSFALASRIGLGDFTGFASREAALAELERQATLAGSMYASGQSMVSNSARLVRRQRFTLDPAVVDRIKEVGGDRLSKLFAATLGDPTKIKRVVNPTFLARAGSDIGFVVQNNLLWSLGTYAVKSLSDGSMLILRPTGRIVGGLAQGNVQQAAEAARQMGYYYLGLKDGLPGVMNAFKTADSTLTGRHTAFSEGSRMGPITQAALSTGWKPFDSMANISYNAYLAAVRTVALPTRAMAAADELAKQTNYRSYVASKAWSEGKASGLAGDALSKFVTDKLNASIGNDGAALDPVAAQEAKVASFTQDLTGIPTNFGGPALSSTIANAVGQHPLLRLILPFTHTPANIFRYAVKMTPVVNMLQAEYRAMLSGKMGAEQQANAIGQMALGATALGSIAVSGLDITGGGPADPHAKQALLDTGWRPYSLVWESKDGTKNYFPIGRVEPLALPFGIVADIQDYLHLGGDAAKAQGPISALLASLTMQAANKTYLPGISRVVEAFDAPQQKMDGFVGKSLAELVPFASLLSKWNPDPFMREARSMTDNLIANIPGLSATLPPRYDALGQPLTARRSFISSSPPDAVAAETQRMATQGYDIIPPVPTMKNADLRDVTTATGRNAWDWYQQLAGQPSPNVPSLKDQVGKVMASPAYGRAPDGPGDVLGTKLFMLHGPVSDYRKAAAMEIQKDPNVRAALLSAQQKVTNAYHDQRAGVSQQTTNADTLRNIVGHFTQYLTPPAQQQ